MSDTASPAPFVRRRVIVIRHRGNVANKLIQYLGAMTIAGRIPGCEIVNVSIPEFGIEIPDDTRGQQFLDTVDLWTWNPFAPHVEALARLASASGSIKIEMAEHLQRMEFLLDPHEYAGVFPPIETECRITGPHELVINVRTAEILDGVPHYPLVPIAFYEDLVARTGLAPVFVGQLGDCEYVRRLRARFPEARFIESRGARGDFDILRSAKNIVVAISTFSWLAAWLSEAHNVFLPMSGFYNPAHHREIDLLPADDVRYRFFLFPMNFGVPEPAALRHHDKMSGHWKEISRNQVNLLRTAAPFLRPPREAHDNGLPVRSARGAQVTFDPVWYAHQYIDAATEISEGWFEDPLHHYLEVGRLRGYHPVPRLQDSQTIDAGWRNLALNKPAMQSSTSQWSRGASVEEDAAMAVNGKPWEPDGFHTGEDEAPWWMVDLGETSTICAIRVFNRDRQPEWLQKRASPLRCEASSDQREWTTLFETEPDQLFGGYSGGAPLVWIPAALAQARFVRLSLSRKGVLHLAEVQVFGPDPLEVVG